MSVLARIIAELDDRIRAKIQESQAVEAGFMRTPTLGLVQEHPEPSGIGTSKGTIVPHPSQAPYPYIVDDGRPA